VILAVSSLFVFNYNPLIALEVKLCEIKATLKAFFSILVDIEPSLVGFQAGERKDFY
jgi:hypothetical protein